MYPHFTAQYLINLAGIEGNDPSTSCVTSKRSTTELYPQPVAETRIELVCQAYEARDLPLVYPAINVTSICTSK